MANILWEMIVKMLTHIHMVVYTWWHGKLIRRFRENRMPIFYYAGCKFLWLAHWSKGDEDRSENELVAKTLASVN